MIFFQDFFVVFLVCYLGLVRVVFFVTLFPLVPPLPSVDLASSFGIAFLAVSLYVLQVSGLVWVLPLFGVIATIGRWGAALPTPWFFGSLFGLVLHGLRPPLAFHCLAVGAA